MFSLSEEIEDVVSTLSDEEELGQCCIRGGGSTGDESMGPVEMCFVMKKRVMRQSKPSLVQIAIHDKHTRNP